MLKAKVLARILKQANTSGVSNTMLLSQEGTLLAHSGDASLDPAATGAIVSNIWMSYYHGGLEALKDDELVSLIVMLENGVLLVSLVDNILICLHGKKSTPIGLMKLKAKALISYLEKPLREVRAAGPT